MSNTGTFDPSTSTTLSLGGARYSVDELRIATTFNDVIGAPSIAVEQPAGTRLISGSGSVDFGSSPVSTPVVRTFTLRNNGQLPLTVSGVTIDGTNSADFTLTTPPASVVAVGSSTTFTVTFTAGDLLSRSGALHISSNDPGTSSFTVNLSGTGIGTLTASYSTGLEVPLTATSLPPTGAAVNFFLNYAPTAGTTLTVVKNTDLGFINGTFDNLAQGQVVPLTSGGMIYTFVASYYGGTGNDLVLQWANVRPVSWGLNGDGQLGDNSTTNGLVPVPVVQTWVLAGKTATAVANGGYHSLALCSDGTLAAWGSNTFGVLGDNSGRQ